MGKSEENDKTVEKEEKAPDSLLNISEGIDELLLTIDSIEETLKLSESEFQAINSQKDKSKNQDEQSSNETIGGSQQQEEESNQAQQEQSNDSQKAQEDKNTRDEELFLKWQDVDKKI